MKKKIVSICLVAVIAVMAIAGASLAYLTDTDDADNVFEVGNVQIELVEQQRDENGGLEAFEDNKILMPIVGSAQGEKDGLRLIYEEYIGYIYAVVLDVLKNKENAEDVYQEVILRLAKK